MCQIMECVPNFSEGRDPQKIKTLVRTIQSVGGVNVLHVDSGYAANRTVITFAGKPELVVEAAFQAVKKAAGLIDMRFHSGEHPRFGATDVLPLVPVANISMEETIEWSMKLGRRIGEELGISVFCYENSADSEQRRSLALCRSGEYEGLAEKMKRPEWKPDFGPATLNARSGAVALGARPFLIAYNVNLKTTDVGIARHIAGKIRESGCVMPGENRKIRLPGELKKLRAIGWFIREYGMAQVAMNLLDYSVTSVHQAFETVAVHAEQMGIEVAGSELIGLVPLAAILDTGRYYARRQGKVPDSADELICFADRGLGLSQLSPFDPALRILEYRVVQAE